MMATEHSPTSGGLGRLATSPAPNGAYKRASRKGAARRFYCEHPGCDKIYSRAEHLQRHQLNHNPKEIFRCDIDGCDQKFVRADLLARHKKRHSSSYTPRNRAPSFSTARPDAAHLLAGSNDVSPTNAIPSRTSFSQQASSGGGPHDAAILLTPESNAAPTPTAMSQGPPSNHATSRLPPQHWAPPPMDDMTCNIIRPKPGYYQHKSVSMAEPPPMMPYTNVPYQQNEEHISRENFAVWLFDPQASFHEFGGVASMPFLEGGLESTFNSNIHYDYESLGSTRSQLDPTPPRQVEMSDELLTEHRRQDVLHWFQNFRRKQPNYESLISNLVHDSGGDLPALNLEMMRDCLQEYWKNVSPRLPIVHQPTFSCNRCSIFLLMVMIALGAASLRGRDTTGSLTDYGAFADVIISSVRWEIVTAEDAAPPVGLAVAQALLLLEFYEKMYSSRRLHERAHIYHSATLTLLRRGSPLIGRAGSESPPEEQAPSSADQPHGIGLDARTWWIRWAETESMHRVVFAAFMVDIIHAAMFGHTADMAPHEIRLPLPCDDNLWTASSPDTVRRLDNDLRLYGVKQVSFLDGLKSALHGKEVKTHSFGRMIIMSGLLSVGWHLSHRERHLKWLDLRTPSTETQGSWRQILLKAFDDWKESFDSAIGSNDFSEGSSSSVNNQRGCSNGPIHSAAVLYHLAHISLHVDIIDCQVYAGAKRLLGRRVSRRDYANAVSRMKLWASSAATRHAVLHAFRLLYVSLVDQRAQSKKQRAGNQNYVSLNSAVNDHLGPASLAPHPPPLSVHYSCRTEADPHRPWIMYYAALSIWSYARALGVKVSESRPGRYSRIAGYLSVIASSAELGEREAGLLGEGLPELLDVLKESLGEAHSELLQEACERLKVCGEMLAGAAG